MEDYGNDYKLIDAAIKELPNEFELRVLPGKFCRISPSESFVSVDNGVQLYVVVLTDGNWQAWARGTVAEIKAQITKVLTA